MKNNPDIDFYRSGAVHTVLKRYDFSDDEKKIIQAAIVTAKKEDPNMALIEKSDALLKMVAASREAAAMEAEQTIDHKGIAKAVAHTNMKKYKAPQSAWTTPIEPNNSSYSLHYRILTGFIVAGIISYVMSHNNTYTIKDAREICQEKNEVLPLTIDDFIDSSYKFGRPSRFWLADGTVMMSNTWEKDTASPDTEYDFICVSENGHKGEYTLIYSGTR